MQTSPFEKETTEIYTVSQLNGSVRALLEAEYPMVWVEGEISNFTAPHSGHWYFSLKDASAQIRCALFRGNQRHLGFKPKDGMHVLIKGRLSLYENRGDYQLIADDMEERGEGQLRRAFEVLKKKLQAAGLFELTHKKALPKYPQQIGVITSATGAAIRDILHVLKRRYSSAAVIIYPTLVQGQQAAPNIAHAIQLANIRQECDVLILARGGGSLEDLWSFNEEIVAEAIYASHIPIISGIGHEVDFTIADFVADIRAPTPSAAAELVSPDKNELLKVLSRCQQQCLQHIRQALKNNKERISWLQTHLKQQHPKRQLQEKMQRLDFLEATLTRLQTSFLQKQQSEIKDLHFRLQQKTPVHHIKTKQQEMARMQDRLMSLMMAYLHQLQSHLTQTATKLDALSPLSTLKRGYAIALNKEQQIIRAAEDLHVGDEINLKLQQGAVGCKVVKILPPFSKDFLRKS